MLISESYREQNRLLHETHAGYGAGGAKWAPYIARLMREEHYETALDYGCGKGLLADEMLRLGLKVEEYDPAIPGKDAEPQPADLVICTDVLEHIEPVHLGAFIRDLRRVARRKLFFNVATRPAAKTLPDGRNAHLIVRPADWWRKRLSREFHIVSWEVRPGLVYGEAVPRYHAQKVPPPVRKRRAITPEWQALFNHIKRENQKYCDAFGRIDSIRMWESVDDETADMQVACNILEHVPDPEAELRKMIRHARKAVMATIVLDAQRGEAYWREVFERFLRISEWKCENGAILLIGAPKVDVAGVIAVGAVDSEERFAQVKSNVLRTAKRIEPSGPHGKWAIIACYGPSLADNVDRLRQEIADTGGDVISVSGAHDFLIQNGIVPTYHVECDPRAHKADNIEKAHPGVAYLIGSVCHPVLFDKLEGADVRLWHVGQSEHNKRIVDELGEDPGHIISGGGSVGLRSIPLLYSLGYRDMSIFGMDCSFKDEGKTQWAGKHAGKRQDCCQVLCGERVFVSSAILLTYATNFWETVQKVDDLTVRLFGDGLLQAMARLYMPMVPHIQEAA